MSERRKRVLVAALASLATFLAIAVILTRVTSVVEHVWLGVIEEILRRGGPPALIPYVLVLGEAVIHLPAFVVALLVYDRFAGLRRPNGNTYCGFCGYILKGLRDPRCPECGRAI